MPKQLTDATRDSIKELADAGMDCAKIARVLGVSQGTVETQCGIYAYIEQGRPLTPSMAKQRPIIKWACDRTGNDAVMPAEDGDPVRQSDDSANAVTAFVQLAEAIGNLTDTVAHIDARLSAMQMTIQGIRQETGESVKKVVETININGDIATRERMDIKDRLEAIKINTKKMGKQQ